MTRMAGGGRGGGGVVGAPSAPVLDPPLVIKSVKISSGNRVYADHKSLQSLLCRQRPFS